MSDEEGRGGPPQQDPDRSPPPTGIDSTIDDLAGGSIMESLEQTTAVNDADPESTALEGGGTEAEENAADDNSGLHESGPPSVPVNTRNTTFLSKESSLSICSEPGGGSKENSFVSINETSQLAAKIGSLPQNSPTADQPLVDLSGNVRHVTPRNVKLEQYYVAVEDKDEPEIVHHKKKPGSVGALVATEKELTQVGLGQDDREEDEEIEEDDEEEEEEDELEEEREEETEEQYDEDNRSDIENVEDVNAELFSTAVGEDVIEAARARQTGLYDPPWMIRDQQLPSLNDVVHKKAEEHYTRGLEHAENKDMEKAIQCYTKAINLKSRDLRFYVQRGESFLYLADFQSAILNYKRACVLDPENSSLYNRLAFIYFFNGQCLFDQKLFPEALEAFSRATEMRPEVIGYHTRSIACLAALQRHGECLALVNKRLEIEQENADLYVMRARLHQLFRNTTLAYYDIKDALSLDPQHEEARIVMTRLQDRSVELKHQAVQLNLLGRHRDALQKISLAIETNPSVADYHVTRGALHRRLSDFNAAIDDYLLALDKTDHDEESATYLESQRQLLLTYNDFAVECFTKGYFEEAIILLNKAIKGEKREKGLYINRGDCFFREGNLQFAMADYHQALELDGHDTTIRSRIAILHNEYGVQEFQDKNFQEADSRFTLAIQHNPGVGHFYISRCRARQMMENLSGARQDILIALLLDPSNTELMPILTRLFPGKSVKDILQSKVTGQARKALENLVVTASPVRLNAIDEGLSGEPTKTVESDATVVMDTAHSAAGTLWKPAQTIPDIKSCMEEKEFNIQIAAEKHKYNSKVKKILHNRTQLQPVMSKVKPLPPPANYTRRGGASNHGNKSSDSLLPLDEKVQVQPAAGWKDFGLGIGMPDTAN